MKYYYMRKILLLIFATIPFLNAFSQESEFSIWSVTAEAGFTVFDGDVNQSRMQLLPTSIRQVSYGGTVEYAISPIWGLALDFYHFPIEANNLLLVINTPLNTTDLNATINFTKLVFPSTNSKVSILGAIGLGYAWYTSNYRIVDPNLPLLINPTISLPGQAISIPVTFSLEYNISKYFAIGGKVHYRAYNKDNMEGEEHYNYKGVTNDFIGSGMAYLRYKINQPNKKNHRRNINMKLFDPPCCADIDNESDITNSRIDSIMRFFDTKMKEQNNKIDSLTKLLSNEGPDTDEDGVPDLRDKDNLSPANTPVDFWGRTIILPEYVTTINTTQDGSMKDDDNIPAVFFDFDKTGLDAKALETIRKVSAKMKADTTLMVEVRGYCDFVGNKAYNEDLSQRRSNKVKAEMMKVWGIPTNRIIANGKGKVIEPQSKFRPNRRCDFFFSK